MPLNFPFDKLHLHQASTSVVHSANKFMSGLASGFPLLPSFHLLLISSCSVLLPLFTWLLPPADRHHGRRRESWSVFLQRGGGSCFGTGSASCHSFLHVCCCAHSNPTRCLCTTSFPSTAHPPPLQTNKLCSRNIFRRHGAKLRVRTPPPALQGRSRTKVAALGVAVFVSLMA